MLAFGAFIDNKQMHMNHIGLPYSMFQGVMENSSSSLPFGIDVMTVAVVVAVYWVVIFYSGEAVIPRDYYSLL